MNLKKEIIDGLVITTKSDRFAFKQNKDGSTTKVIGIEWNKSIHGKLVPVLNLIPVEIDGTTVKRVSGNSYEYLCSKKIQLGSTVKIIKAGEIIPYVVEVYNTKEFTPDNLDLPKIEMIRRGANLYSADQSDVDRNNLIRFLSRIKVDQVGATLINTYCDLIIEMDERSDIEENELPNPYIEFILNNRTRIESLINSTPNKLSPLQKQKLITMINKDHKVMDVLLSISSEGVGSAKMSKLLDNPNSDESLMYNKLINKYKLVGETSDDVESINLSVVITGKLTKPISEIENRLKSLGIGITSIGKADILICNETFSNSSKFHNAKKRGIPIMTEESFEDFLKRKGVI